jgi:hypothetical protein
VVTAVDVSGESLSPLEETEVSGSSEESVVIVSEGFGVVA